MSASGRSEAIIVFDGVCVLCSHWVGFLLKRDHDHQFRFAAMQSDTGRRLLQEAGLDPDDPSSFILVDGGAVRRQTDAIATVLRRLKAPWPFVASFILLWPRAFRDWFYFRIARSRYRMFGKKTTCYVPAPSERERFLT